MLLTDSRIVAELQCFMVALAIMGNNKTLKGKLTTTVSPAGCVINRMTVYIGERCEVKHDTRST